MVNAAGLTGNILLFCLVYGMSATVDIRSLIEQLKNTKALLTGAFLQFVVLPLLGFLVVKFLKMESAMGITILVITSSPGGSFSNWWCSMFNADLALSVTMTALSTLLSIIMMPMNLMMYAKFSFNADVVAALDWGSLFTALIIVIGAILAGLLTSYKVHSHRFNKMANMLGNVAGLALIGFSILMSNSNEDARLWERDWTFYVGVSAPCILGLIVGNLITSYIGLKYPERITVSIECCYQNVGIATSVALTMFEGDELAEAMGAPLFYGTVEAVVLGIYCVAAWKCGWTKAPPDASFCTMIGTSYEVLEAEREYGEAYEISLGDAFNCARYEISDDNNSTFHYKFWMNPCQINNTTVDENIIPATEQNTISPGPQV